MRTKDAESSENMLKILNRNKKLLRIINLISFSSLLYGLIWKYGNTSH